LPCSGGYSSEADLLRISLNLTTMRRTLMKLLFLAAIFTQVLHAEAMEKTALQLRWLPQFQFAGYYAALEKGYYAKAGRDDFIVKPVNLDTLLHWLEKNISD